MLSIIIPFYKIAFFDTTMQSLANQSNKNFNVFIGDDASPDDCSSLLIKFKNKFNFEYKRFETNLGRTSLTQQWERCIALSDDAEWIMILGDDDFLDENVVAEFYNNLEEINKYACNVVKFATQTVDVRTNTSSKLYENLKLEDAASFYFGRFSGNKRSSLSEHIFKKNVYAKYGFKNYPLAWYSDDYAWLSFAEKKPIYCINSGVVKIHISSESISGSDKDLNLKNLAAAQFHLDVVKTKLPLFSRAQRIKLLYQTEIWILKTNKISTTEWKVLGKAYFANFSTIAVLKFIRRFFKQFL